MRDISPEMQARLTSGATFLCRCWRVERRDGLVLGFTDHDVDLAFDGTVFRADSGLDSSVIEAGTGLSVDNAQAVGALSGASLSEADIIAGKYDGATVLHWLVDWQKPELRVLLFRGTLGEIRRGPQAFEAELRGLSEGLNQTTGRSYLRRCDRILGDSACGVDLSGPAFSAVATVQESTREQLVLEGLSAYGAGWFENGLLRWPDGSQSLIKLDEIRGPARVLGLFEAIKTPVAAGSTVQVVAGCDKSAAGCAGRFDNLVNFRGFPHIPGEDRVLAYPAAGEVHDGASLFGGA